MEIRVKKTNHAVVEALYFEEFIISALKDCEVVRNQEYLLHDEYASKTVSRFDGYLPNGLPGHVNGSAFLEIKYVESPSYIHYYISRIRERLPSEYRLIIICLVNARYLHVFDKYKNITVLGADYVGELAKKHPTQWLAFSASCRPEDNIISYDEERNAFSLANKTLASSEVQMDHQFNSDDIKQLSEINKRSFRDELNSSSGGPAIFIGNGASVCFGSDLWKPLCDYLFDYLNPKYVDKLDLVRKAIGDTTFSLSSMTKCLIDRSKYYAAIYSSLYRKYESSMHDSSTLIRSAVKVKEHFQSMPIITYNYDDFFEIDYKKYTKNAITSIDDQAKDAAYNEPKIRHVHGLFPYGKSYSRPNLVLTQEEYYDAYRSGTGWAPTIQKQLLRNNVCLFIGSSMSDLYQMSIINEIYNEYYSKRKTRPWKCFALLCFKDLTARDIYSVCNYYASKGVYVIFTEDFKDLPGELLRLFGLK